MNQEEKINSLNYKDLIVSQELYTENKDMIVLTFKQIEMKRLEV
jgi:hypothetical protein